jgi:8-amino-7-oxononanoate synthase
MSLVDGWAQATLEDLDARGLKRTLEPLASPQGPVVELGGRSLLNFSSNDYLSLAGHPEVVAAGIEGLQTWGAGSGASRLVVGDNFAHRALEAALARFHGTGAALLFSSGYAANVGALQALVGPGDVVFSDAWNHASLIDGCRLSRATVVVYPHRDVTALRALVAQHPGARRLVVTDAVFSMDGDLAPLPELAALCAEAGLGLYVDEAHGTGVLGPTGAGLCEATGVRPSVLMGTLSKALGGLGGYVAASRPVVELLLHRARAQVFSTALPPAVCASALAALHLVVHDEARRARLTAHRRHLQQGLEALGLPGAGGSAIFPVVLGSAARAMETAEFLRESGLLVKAIRPPTVPEGTSRLRLALAADHAPHAIDALLTALRRLEVGRSA